PWTIARDRLVRSTGIPNVKLLNDLEAMAHGTLAIPAEHTAALNVGVGRPGHRAVIAAGTGLGQAFLYWDGSVHHPVATEGGHASFAPRDGEQVELLEFLRCRHDHVSWERVLSGPGLEAIFDFLGESRGLRAREPVISRIDAGESVAAVVGEAGVTGACDTCRRAVDLFLQLYGMQAANLALTVFALGGVYVGGGIIRKLLPRALEGPFREGFLDVGRLRKLLETIPVRAIREPRTAVTGAARVAVAAVRSGR
ncbi:MAG: glucokinase, partial [Gemmatimonadota bacterium]